MLSEVTLQNFKCFRQYSIPLRPTTIIVGRNNAGKSTIVEALRLVSLVSNRLQNLPVRDVPSWLDIPKVNRGVSPSLNNQSFDFGNVFHRYGEPPAKITARFSTGVGITIYIGGPERIHAVIKDARRNVVISKGQARNIGVPRVGILPQIGPLPARETILVPDYVRKFISSNLSSTHFRNELNLLFDDAFAEFKDISEGTWHGLAIQELRGQAKTHGRDLELMVRNDDFVAEVGWMGHGLQMWLQTMWFSLASGKLALSALSHWLQDNYGVSISASAIVHEMRPSEVHGEIASVLTAIEYGDALQPETTGDRQGQGT